MRLKGKKLAGAALIILGVGSVGIGALSIIYGANILGVSIISGGAIFSTVGIICCGCASEPRENEVRETNSITMCPNSAYESVAATNNFKSKSQSTKHSINMYENHVYNIDEQPLSPVHLSVSSEASNTTAPQTDVNNAADNAFPTYKEVANISSPT